MTTTPQPSTDKREEIARIIDPVNWRKHDALRRNANVANETAELMRDIWRSKAKGFVAPSLAKADAIMALFANPETKGEA